MDLIGILHELMFYKLWQLHQPIVHLGVERHADSHFMKMCDMSKN